ncbi:MBL fold metallo-hydrolase [Natrinema sp. LN54]|uniref:MBL fold metallo-hydrolase n=1 Tax=Natrinema sp. LN54 TaxID=3458705 RepID=UPI00403713A6
MRISYQHANINSGNESTLLRFTAADDTRTCILVDAGDGVNLDTLLADDEYLNAILLTHPHIDHYRTLATNVRHSAPIYTADTTAAILEQALPEATQDNDLGDVSAALDALEPIADWTSILNGLEVRPIAAGHTPGGAGFLVRFHDETATDDPLHGEQHILISGDFTTRSCAGFPGLATSYPFDIDCLLLNVASNDSYTTSLNESIQSTLEHAYAGSRVVVAASSLTGVHYATLLGHCTEILEREVPITLVGQAAKLYDSLEYDVSGVEPIAVFDQTNEVLADGGITIAGPEMPTTGSTQRLRQAIGDDPAAAFVQLTTGDEVDPADTRCTTQAFSLSNHPSSETITDIVHDIAPKEVVIKHASGRRLKKFQQRFDRCFTWGTNDTGIHCLYENGNWQVPDWITDSTASRIQSRQWEAIQEQSLEIDAPLSRCRHGSINLEAEGVDLDALEETFSGTIEDPYSGTDPENDGSKPAESDEDDRQHDRSFEEDVLARLETIETTLERSEETVSARVLSDGADTQVLELLETADVEAGDVVDVTIKTEPSDD